MHVHCTQDNAWSLEWRQPQAPSGQPGHGEGNQDASGTGHGRHDNTTDDVVRVRTFRVYSRRQANLMSKSSEILMKAKLCNPVGVNRRGSSPTQGAPKRRPWAVESNPVGVNPRGSSPTQG